MLCCVASLGDQSTSSSTQRTTSLQPALTRPSDPRQSQSNFTPGRKRVVIRQASRPNDTANNTRVSGQQAAVAVDNTHSGGSLGTSVWIVRAVVERFSCLSRETPDRLLNPLECYIEYLKLVYTLSILMGWLLHLVQRGGDWARPQPAQAPPRCIKCISPPINGMCTNYLIAV